MAVRALRVLIIALLAFGVGFATQRGSICGILAARLVQQGLVFPQSIV
jgi:hypothetical protein